LVDSGGLGDLQISPTGWHLSIMVQLLTVLLLGLLGIPNLGVAKLSNHKYSYSVKEVHHPLQEWTRMKDAPKDEMLLLRIGLKMDRWEELERHLYEG
jgi:hypothetical protein